MASSLTHLHCSCMRSSEVRFVAEHDAVNDQGFVAIFGLHCCAALMMDTGSTIVEPFLSGRIVVSRACVTWNLCGCVV
jgi:hypothetical protein